jgi:hypothetical protein
MMNDDYDEEEAFDLLPEEVDELEELKKKGYVPVQDKDDLVRDPVTGAIINKNKSAYENYLSASEKRANQRKKVDDLQTEVSSMKSDVTQIKQLLQQLLENQK